MATPIQSSIQPSLAVDFNIRPSTLAITLLPLTLPLHPSTLPRFHAIPGLTSAHDRLFFFFFLYQGCYLQSEEGRKLATPVRLKRRPGSSALA